MQQQTKTEDILAQNYPLCKIFPAQKRWPPIEVINRINTVPLTSQQTVALMKPILFFLVVRPAGHQAGTGLTFYLNNRLSVH
jgi:hypothetical protein